MVDAEVDSLLENLQQLLLYHVHLIKNAKEQVELLERDLRLFKSFLKDSSKELRREDSLRELVCQIRDVVYEAEDVIDSFVTESRSKNYFVRAFQTPVKLLTIAKEVEKVGSKVRGIYGDKGKFDFTSLSVGDGGPEESEAPRVRQEYVVGFEDERSEIIRYLTEETEKPDVITLVGMPGIGKTTLAWKIFVDPDIKCEFPTRIWVHVSNELTKKNVFLTVLRQLNINTEDVKDKSEKELEKLVISHLENTKFLIVLDDVWSVSDWNRLRRIVEPKSKRGKVLITSCNEEVGVYAHKVRFLNESESWELLQLEVLGETKCPPQLETVGKLIAKQCDGLPLAILTMGGILVREDLSCVDINARKTAWTRACHSVPKYSNKNFYDNLPSHLQICFLYLAAFPYDFEIPVGQLILMWIAEGFIKEVESLRMEETAESYVNNLVQRNLLKVCKMKDNGRVKTCRIHRMLHDFIKIEAGIQRENVLTEIKCIDGVFEPSVFRVSECRRLSLHSNALGFLSSKPFGPRTRSFVCFSKEEICLTADNISTIPAAFKLLRLLDVKPIKFFRLPSDFYHLVHLRYLALSLNFQVLPAAFHKLWNIQTLLIDTTSRVLDIKVDIFRFAQLRHFKTNVSANLFKSGKYSEKLQSLGMVAPESCTEEVCCKARNLKKLGIRGKLLLLLDEEIGSFNYLVKLSYLENLKLVNDVYPLPPSGGRLDSLPPAYKFPPTLKSLTLAATFLDWSQMRILRRLENLEVLKLKDNAFAGRIWETYESFDSFESLEALHIGRTDLVIWVASADQFPRLKTLKLRHCEQLQEVPIELADIPSLQILDLFETKIAAASAKRFLKKKDAKEFRLSIYPQVQYE